jgi:hypothetical protein
MPLRMKCFGLYHRGMNAFPLAMRKCRDEKVSDPGVKTGGIILQKLLIDPIIRECINR